MEDRKREYKKTITTEIEVTDLSISYAHRSVRIFYVVKKKIMGSQLASMENNIFLKGEGFENFIRNFRTVNQTALKEIEAKEGLKMEEEHGDSGVSINNQTS